MIRARDGRRASARCVLPFLDRIHVPARQEREREEEEEEEEEEAMIKKNKKTKVPFLFFLFRWNSGRDQKFE